MLDSVCLCCFLLLSVVSSIWVIQEETSCNDAMEPVGMTNQAFESIPHSLVPHFPNWSHMISHRNDPEFPKHSKVRHIKHLREWPSPGRMKYNCENAMPEYKEFKYEFTMVFLRLANNHKTNPFSIVTWSWSPCWGCVGIMTVRYRLHNQKLLVIF